MICLEGVSWKSPFKTVLRELMRDKHYAYLHGLKKISPTSRGEIVTIRTIPLRLSLHPSSASVDPFGKAASYMDIQSHWNNLNVAEGVKSSS